jgi:hypothetical protein
MDWEKKQKERIENERKERLRLMALTEEEAMKEGAPIWYQRMRYFREIEASEWLANIRRSLPSKVEKPFGQKMLYVKQCKG